MVGADIRPEMMISDEQARRAARFLHRAETWGRDGTDRRPLVDEELVERLSRVVSRMPDTRPDRIAHARAMLCSPPSAADIAEKMIERIVSDALR